MIGHTELLLVFLVILIIFGGSQIPKLARALGSSVSSFKKGVSEGAEEEPVKPVSVYEKLEKVEAPVKKGTTPKTAAKKTVKKTAAQKGQKPKAAKKPASRATVQKASSQKKAPVKTSARKTTAKKAVKKA